jgi:RimJ/RimL family protein N-acetyltransferase
MAAQTTPAHPAAMETQTDTTTVTADSPTPAPLITTQRLIIRNMHPPDAPSMSLHANNPRVTNNMSLAFPDPYTIDQANIWINMNINIPQINNWCICERGSPDVVIGGIGLKMGTDVESHTAEVGYWVGEEFWGRGYMTEVLEALTEWCFLERKADGGQLKKLWSSVYSTNVGSMRCFEKCGYAKEGVQRDQAAKYGRTMDLHLFGMTKGDWEERWKQRHAE